MATCMRSLWDISSYELQLVRLVLRIGNQTSGRTLVKYTFCIPKTAVKTGIDSLFVEISVQEYNMLVLVRGM